MNIIERVKDWAKKIEGSMFKRNGERVETIRKKRARDKAIAAAEIQVVVDTMRLMASRARLQLLKSQPIVKSPMHSGSLGSIVRPNLNNNLVQIEKLIRGSGYRINIGNKPVQQ